MRKNIFFLVVIYLFSSTIYSCDSDDTSNNSYEEEINLQKELLIGDWYPYKKIEVCSEGETVETFLEFCIEDYIWHSFYDKGLYEEKLCGSQGGGPTMIPIRNGQWSLSKDLISFNSSDTNKSLAIYKLTNEVLQLGLSESIEPKTCNENGLVTNTIIEYLRFSEDDLVLAPNDANKLAKYLPLAPDNRWVFKSKFIDESGNEHDDDDTEFYINNFNFINSDNIEFYSTNSFKNISFSGLNINVLQRKDYKTLISGDLELSLIYASINKNPILNGLTIIDEDKSPGEFLDKKEYIIPVLVCALTTTTSTH